MRRDNLVIDVGMHTGQDTEFYLAKGYDVVAVEANPVLVEDARRRFAGPIDEGRLRIFDVAISERSGTERLAVADDVTIWSSLSPDIIDRNIKRGNTSYRYVEVPSMRFEDILTEVGVPHFLKVDIEGLDMLCVRALHQFAEQPRYISIESAVSGNRPGPQVVFDELAQLWVLGYRRFKFVDQSRNETWTSSVSTEDGLAEVSFARDSSGPFGEESTGRWRSVTAAHVQANALALHHNLSGYGGAWTYNVPALVYRQLRHRIFGRRTGWYDLHAALG